ncbi:MAG: Yip1 family protein [Nanoarchaeota archaeon]
MKLTALFEIALLVVAIASFSYIIGQYDAQIGEIEEEGKFVKAARGIIIGLLDDNLVSAADGIWTCAQDKQGSVCQEYPAINCNANCNVPCFTGRRADFGDCRLGTCIDKIEGTCSPQSPKKLCESGSGVWKADETSELVECRRGCCLIGDGAQFLTEKSCQTSQARLGLAGEFRPVDNELQCLALANREVEGACVFGLEEDRSCKFIKKGSCLDQGGQFFENKLCSSAELQTDCEKQKRIGCFPDRDEVYWFDSCGNRENIYDANKDKSWNNGLILAKGGSCELAIGNNLLARQGSCGNCNYLLGSVCGVPRAQDEKPSAGNAVCRDLNCIDEKGNKRKHGEAWCAFESQIGIEGTGNAQRSVDVPGSTHYRKVCFEGEIKIEPCQGFRNEVCVESRDEVAKFSQAQCRVNLWQKCLEANGDKDKLADCEKTTDCKIKTVDLGKGFKFDRCVPKTPPGFDLLANAGGEVSEGLCSLGTQTCTVVYQKSITGKWKCKQNCDCRKAKFTETMNNLCMSLGDCGASVNVAGEFTDAGYSVKKAPKLSQAYIAALKTLATPKEGQKVAPLSEAEITALFNLDPSQSSSSKQSKIGEYLGYLGLGATGTAYAAGAILGPSVGPGAISYTFGQFGAWGNALGSVAAGAAIGFVIGKALGLEGDALTAVVLASAITAVVVTQFFNVALLSFAFLAWVGGVGLVVGIGLLLIGVGKTKKVKVEFTCNPWQPPKGGASCDKCGKDGLPCNKYQCQSLGQLCEFVNEGTKDEACINVNPNDVLSPIIKPYQDALIGGFSYTNIGDNGYTLKGSGSDGCVPAYQQVRFGISLNERGACKIDSVRKVNFDAMEFNFGGSSLYKFNHTQILFLPSLDALAQAQSEGVVQDNEEPIDTDLTVVIDPTKRNDFTIYARCQDKSGNSNVNEYAINFCISAAPDRTAPIINEFIPASPGYIAFGGTGRNVTFFVNEPSECRWASIDSDYDSMTQQAICNSDVEDVTIKGFECSTNLPVTTDVSNYYFRCKDQPWLTGNVTLDNGKTRNKNAQSALYVLRKTAIPLTIVSINPNNKTISSGGIPIVVDLEVQTAGGQGPRYCEFSSAGQFVTFFENSGDRHKQPGLQFIEQRAYDIPIRCKDEAGNVASSSAKFTTYIDNQGPRITRAFRQNGLTIVTNENARCAYSLRDCTFLFSNGTLLTGNELVHSTSFNITATHYVSCRDRFDNPGACIAVRAGEF